MSTSLLYHAFGIRGYHYTRTDYQGGQVTFTIEQEPHTCRCSRDVRPRGHVYVTSGPFLSAVGRPSCP